MKVDMLNLQTLFYKPVRYEIPLFQRRYVWQQEEQWEPLWEDVRNAAEQIIELGGHNVSHFLGAVVLKQQLQASGMLEMREVVDGQQRLTTMQLLLDAVQEVFERHGATTEARQLSALVLNDDIYHDDDLERKFKVLPTLNDRESFVQAMSNELSNSGHEDSLIVRAHDYFNDVVDEWLNSYPDDKQRSAIQALHTVVALRLEMVVIDLAPDEEEHVIFETLNARGTPLEDSDLIRNMMLAEASKQGIDEQTMPWEFNDNWWTTQIRQGRLYRSRSDAFFNYWLNMRTQNEVLVKNVFSTFRRYFERSGQSVQQVSKDIKRVGTEYQAIEENKKPGLETFVHRWKLIGAGVLTPVLLWLLSSDAPREQVQKGIRALESYIVRRMLCRMSTMGQNRFFISMLPRLESADASIAGDAVVEYLREQKATTSLWPDDDLLIDAFINQKLYGLLAQMRIRMVLEAIEVRMRTDKAEGQSVTPNLTIEHIMPQGWDEHWGLRDNTENEIQSRIDRNRLIHTMGNLTLTNKRLNTSLSNRPWEEKRAELREHSVLFLNKTLLDNAPDVWDEKAIEARARQLAQVAIEVWPHADKI